MRWNNTDYAVMLFVAFLVLCLIAGCAHTSDRDFHAIAVGTGKVIQK